jgi:threonine synthase
MGETGSRLRALECRACCAEVPADRPVGPCPTCGHTLFAVYDLEGLDGRSWKASWSGRTTSLWRYRELLPVARTEAIVSLGEGGSPILPLGPVDEAPGLRLSVKDDGGLPTGSFKARGMAVAVSRAAELGLSRLYVPSAGNAGVALAAYGARAGVSVRVYLPERTPEPMKENCRIYGAEVIEVPGTLREVGQRARAQEARTGSFDVSTLREPYRVEGKKTMGLEIFEQCGADGLPDAIVYPTGGGTGLVGMHKAFRELHSLALLDREPRLYAVQPDGCAPVVRALDDGATAATPWESPHTVAPGLLVPAPFASERILEAVRESRGAGVTVSDRAIVDAVASLARRFGLSASPEAAATYAALPALRERNLVRDGESVLLYLTGVGLTFSQAALERAVGGPLSAGG